MTRRQVDTSTEYEGRQDLPEKRTITDLTVSFRDPTPQHQKLTMWSEPYRPSPELVAAVNVAIALGRPLLLQGEPGCGKTRLAHAVAYELGLPLAEGYIKSTSRAQDFLYTYDALNRLYDAQLYRNPGHEGQGPGAAAHKDVHHYLEFGPLGRAIAKTHHGQRSVVLIDEIDKADLDFPNDLLLELDRLRFQVDLAPKLKFAVPEDKPNLRPIVIITHNEEKALPTAFLRRCVYHYLQFPESPAALHQVLALHALDEDKVFSAKAIDVLLQLRNKPDLAKKPGLSELIDWVGYMRAVSTPVEELEKLPYIGVLLKQRSDQGHALQDMTG